MRLNKTTWKAPVIDIWLEFPFYQHQTAIQWNERGSNRLRIIPMHKFACYADHPIAATNFHELDHAGAKGTAD